MMEFKDLIARAVTIRQLYADFETRRYGRAWSDEEIALGFVGDMGDLMKLVQARNGIREIADHDAKLAHELADCLWAVIVLAQRYEIDLENAFLTTMNQLEQHLSTLQDKTT